MKVCRQPVALEALHEERGCEISDQMRVFILTTFGIPQGCPTFRLPRTTVEEKRIVWGHTMPTMIADEEKTSGA